MVKDLLQKRWSGHQHFSSSFSLWSLYIQGGTFGCYCCRYSTCHRLVIRGDLPMIFTGLYPIPAQVLGKRFCHRPKLQTNMLLLRLSLPKCNNRMAQGNNRMAQGMQCPHAIRNYMMKVKSRYPSPNVIPPPISYPYRCSLIDAGLFMGVGGSTFKKPSGDRASRLI